MEEAARPGIGGRRQPERGSKLENDGEDGAGGKVVVVERSA